ncbi:hypothetical protein CROQUDRAFT_95165 [Cronartium quercuum f. sp. fusiforme G11]|uniref:Uncharacterized protein n=1 Tax=Cronartium quercuum f. sp. fusiforme G11 TaxID=708437 RepID=A0A9P6TA82_9BASI|nr:hypothetical protein CROQUDRAFT_95165 [Cronartium quercuum f. sp. fusiforme G11]
MLTTIAMLDRLRVPSSAFGYRVPIFYTFDKQSHLLSTRSPCAGAFGVLLIKRRRRLIPSPSNSPSKSIESVTASSGQLIVSDPTDPDERGDSPSLGSVFTPPVLLVRSVGTTRLVVGHRSSHLIPSTPRFPSNLMVSYSADIKKFGGADVS